MKKLLFIMLILTTVIPVFALGVNNACTGSSTEFEESLLTYINNYRAQHGLGPLSFDSRLTTIAEGHSRHMCEKDSLNHDNFEGRFNKSGKHLCVENVGWNSLTPESQFKGWKNSKGHNANMLHKKIKSAGISRTGAYVTFFACE